MTDTAIADAEVIEPGTDLVPIEAPSAQSTNLFHTDDPVQVVDKASKVADALKSVLHHQGLTVAIQGRQHVRVEGWTTLGSMLGVVPVVEWTRKLDNGWEARVLARMMDGRVIGAAEAECTREEAQWAKRDDYALRSMAQTRATSKALRGPLGFIVTLAGYAATPAEEMPAEQAPAAVARRVTADAPKPTERITTAAQRRKIYAKAHEKKLQPLELLNAVRGALDREPVELDEEPAASALHRILDRMPQRYVDPVLAAIGDVAALGDAS